MTPTAEIAPRVRSVTLRNGSRTYLLENHANTTVDIVGLLEGGLQIEPPERAGVAHLTVEMLDRGTRRRSHSEIADALESCGARLRYGLTPEAILLRGRCLQEDLPLVLELLGETLREPSFPDDQLELVREEALVGLREAAFDGHDRALRSAAAMVWGSAHPYARHSLGDVAQVGRLDRTQLESFHARAVAGRALSLAIVGDIDLRRVTALLDAHLGPLPPGPGGLGGEGGDAFWSPSPGAESPLSAARPQAPEDARAGAAKPAQLDAQIEIPDREQIDLVFLGEGIVRSDPQFEACAVANFILGGSFVSRLNQQLRDREGLTYDAHSLIASGRHPGLWYAATGVAPADVGRAAAVLREQLQHLAAEGVTSEELEMSRRHLTGAFPVKLETNRVVAGVLLDGVRSGRGLEYVDRYCERIAALSQAAVDAAARRLVGTGRIFAVSAGTHASA